MIPYNSKTKYNYNVNLCFCKYGKEIERAFKDSIDDYIAWCEEEGVEPEKPYSGKFNVRLSPELHRQISILAKKKHISLNNFVKKAITDEIALLREG